MIIDNISKLSTKKKAMISLCFPCLLYICGKNRFFSKVSILVLTLVYFNFLIQNIYYEIYDIFNSKNIVFIIFLLINLFTYVLIEALKINTKKAYFELFLMLFILLLLVNFHYLSMMFTCITLEGICDYKFNQNLEIILVFTSFILFFFIIQKIFLSHATSLSDNHTKRLK